MNAQASPLTFDKAVSLERRLLQTCSHCRPMDESTKGPLYHTPATRKYSSKTSQENKTKKAQEKVPSQPVTAPLPHTCERTALRVSRRPLQPGAGRVHCHPRPAGSAAQRVNDPAERHGGGGSKGDGDSRGKAAAAATAARSEQWEKGSAGRGTRAAPERCYGEGV